MFNIKLSVDRVIIEDGTRMHFKDRGNGPVVVFSHGEGAPHGLPTTHKDRLNADLPDLLKA